MGERIRNSGVKGRMKRETRCEEEEGKKNGNRRSENKERKVKRSTRCEEEGRKEKMKQTQ